MAPSLKEAEEGDEEASSWNGAFRRLADVKHLSLLAMKGKKRSMK